MCKSGYSHWKCFYVKLNSGSISQFYLIPLCFETLWPWFPQSRVGAPGPINRTGLVERPVWEERIKKTQFWNWHFMEKHREYHLVWSVEQQEAIPSRASDCCSRLARWAPEVSEKADGRYAWGERTQSGPRACDLGLQECLPKDSRFKNDTCAGRGLSLILPKAKQITSTGYYFLSSWVVLR